MFLGMIFEEQIEVVRVVEVAERIAEGAAAERGELRAIPGIGEAIEAKTRQILETGTCDVYERLKERFPLTIIDLLALPGVGAKTVQTLYNVLKITSLEELREAAETGRLREIPRMGEKAERNILDGIAKSLARRGIPIVRAMALTESLAGQLGRQNGVRRALMAGDCRRYREMCDGISVVLVSDKPARALAQAASSFSNADVLEASDSLLRVRSEFGEISVWAAEPGHAGSAQGHPGSSRHRFLQRRHGPAPRRSRHPHRSASPPCA